MKPIVFLVLTTWVVAASAQIRSLTPEQLEQVQRIQGMQGSMQMPTREQMEQMQRDAAEMQALTKEVERLQRLGRYDEAKVAAKRLDELMQRGPLGAMMGGAVGAQFSLTDALGIEKSMMESEGAYLPDPLFVRPVYMRYLPERLSDAAQMPMQARRLMIEAMRQVDEKDYAAADASLKQAAALSDSPQIVESRARLELARGNPKAALSLLEKNTQNAALLGLQAEIQSSMGQPRAAIDAAERALKAAAARGETSAEYAAAENNLGVARHLNGQPALALPHYQNALAKIQRAAEAAGQGEGLMLQMQIPVAAANLGLAFWQTGNTRRASESFRSALDARAYWESQNDAFMTERALLAKAQHAAVEVDAIMSLDPTLGLQTLLERKGALLERRTRTQTAFRRDANAKSEEPSALGRVFESPVTRVEREAAKTQQAQDQDLLREYESVVAERAALAGKPERSAEDAAKIADLDTRIQVMQQRMQMAEATRANRDQRINRSDLNDIARQSGNDPSKMMAAVNERMEQQQRAREAGVRDARASLLSRVEAAVPPDAVLLEMVKYRPLDPRAAPGAAPKPERYGVYLIRASGTPAYLELGDAAALDKLVKDFRALLANPERPGARELGRKLDEALMRPVRERLAGATTLYVAPEGSLNLVPLAALVDEHGKFLLESYTINYLASGRDLLQLGRNEPARGAPLIIADPAFDVAPAPSGVVPAQAGTQPSVTPAQAGAQRSRDFRSTKYSRLPGTAAEAETLKKVIPDATVVTGAAATETAAKHVAGPRILHIATHGFFLEDTPGDSEDPMLRSGLVFAGVNAFSSGADDGVLTALEASNLDLRGTKLVVLSACETGLGDVKNGEGVFGLRRAFVVAGAETLLMSLWQVADDATKDLMTSYYTRLSKGEARSDALRQAQLAMLKDQMTAHPFFWAAFISSGESGALK